VRRLFADHVCVLDRQEVFAIAGGRSRLRRNAAGEDELNVFADAIEFALIARTESLAQPDQKQKRTHAPGDTEHREE
jgi:hypothetical protein